MMVVVIKESESQFTIQVLVKKFACTMNMSSEKYNPEEIFVIRSCM